MIYVQGPCRLWAVQPPSGGGPPSPQLLGYSEDDIVPTLLRTYEPVQVDYAGGSPGEYQIMSKSLSIEFTLVDFDQRVLTIMQSGFVGSRAPYPQSGGFGDEEMGSLMYREEGCFAFAIHSDYAINKPIFTAMGALAGMYIPFARVDGPCPETWGIKRKRVRLRIAADTKMDPMTNTGTLFRFISPTELPPPYDIG